MEKSHAHQRYMEDPETLLRESCPEWTAIGEFIRKYTSRAVIGMSGGLDSSVVAAIAARELGNENVTGLILPAGNQPIDAEYAIRLTEQLGISHTIIDLAPIVESCTHQSALFNDRLALGNLKARLRMMHLYAYARASGAAVLGTGNRAELMIGYFTKYGDGGVDLLPLGQLYKTQVRMLAEELGIPSEIIDRKPTAGLWPGQTDEDEIGVSYAVLDKILLGHELGYDVTRIATINAVEESDVEKVFDKIAASTHKRSFAPMPGPKFESVGARGGKPYPILTVDAIMRHADKFVLIRRGRPPFQGLLAFPGGHVELGQTCEDAVIREVKEETNLDFRLEGLLGVYSAPKRDPRGHYVTVVFYGSGTGTLKAGDDARDVGLYSGTDLKDLAFDHETIWRDYLRWVGM